MRVTIATGLVERCLALAAATPAVEVCGLLLGQGDRIAAMLPASNVAEDPGRWFEVDPAVLFAAHRTTRSGGPAVIGCWHSHPNGDPTPSPRDAAAAQADDFWLVIGGGQARLYRAGPAGRFAACTMTSA